MIILGTCLYYRFQPFKRRDRKYEPLLHSTSKFGHLPFGTKYYREEFLDKHITPKVILQLVFHI